MTAFTANVFLVDTARVNFCSTLGRFAFWVRIWGPLQVSFNWKHFFRTRLLCETDYFVYARALGLHGSVPKPHQNHIQAVHKLRCIFCFLIEAAIGNVSQNTSTLDSRAFQHASKPKCKLCRSFGRLARGRCHLQRSIDVRSSAVGKVGGGVSNPLLNGYGGQGTTLHVFVPMASVDFRLHFDTGPTLDFCWGGVLGNPFAVLVTGGSSIVFRFVVSVGFRWVCVSRFVVLFFG